MMAHSTPIELPAPAPRVVSTGARELYFIGNATTLITYAGFTLLTAPAFMHKGDYTPLGHGLYTRREIEPACGPQDLPPLDLVILSHYHGDHFDEAVARVAASLTASGASRWAAVATTVCSGRFPAGRAMTRATASATSCESGGVADRFSA